MSILHIRGEKQKGICKKMITCAYICKYMCKYKVKFFKVYIKEIKMQMKTIVFGDNFYFNLYGMIAEIRRSVLHQWKNKTKLGSSTFARFIMGFIHQES